MIRYKNYANDQMGIAITINENPNNSVKAVPNQREPNQTSTL
jgi:hypothetical protein